MIPVIQTQKKQEQTIIFKGFPLGENTSVSDNLLLPQELAKCVDFKFKRGGRLETRDGVVKYSDTKIGIITDIASCSLTGTQYTIITDADYKVYYLSTLTPTAIGTAAGESFIIPYNDVAIICDGSYLKYCATTAAIKIAYDAGPGGYQYSNYIGLDQTTLTAARVAAKFTSAAFTGYTMPVTKITVKVREVGGTAAITGTIRLVSTDVAIATKVYTGHVPSSAADFIDITFASTDVTTEMLPATEYYASIEGSNFEVQCSTVDGAAGVAYTYAPSTWTADTAKSPIMRVHPGLPPKADFGYVSGNRLWIRDPDKLGWAKFGNLTHLDWSTPNGGGWVGVVDDNANSFEIGGFADLYGDLYVYGTENHPYLCKLTGDSPDQFSLPLLFQNAWATQKTLINVTNDLWNASATGVDNLSGVQEFGDLRTYSVSDPVKDKLDNWVSATAFAGYNAKDGQYWLYMPTYDYVLICHTKQPIRMETGEVRYPWSRYTLPATPSCFKQVGGRFLIGSTDGYVYELDPDEYEDLSTTQIEPEFKTSRVDLPFRYSNLTRIQIMGNSITGTSFDMDMYKDGNSSTSVNTWSDIAFPMSDVITIADLTMTCTAATSAISPSQSPLFIYLNIKAISFQIECSAIQIAGEPVFFDGLMIGFVQLEV